jgi:pimeloyl-ACP methyl ester carboxylesterase/outer membrane protein assembly factor BamB
MSSCLRSLVLRILRTRFLALIVAFSFACSRADAERLVLASASYGKNIIALCDADGKVLWSHKTAGPRTGHAGHHDLQLLDDGHILFHDNWTTIVEMTLDKKVVWTYDSSKQNGNQGKHVEVHAFQRLPNGLTMIAESGVGRIIEVDRAGKVHAEIALKPGGRQNTRMARKLDNGNYLVCAENPGVVTEYDNKGTVVWEYPIKTRVYGAIRLRNGNTLIASGSGASVVEVTPAGKVVWEIKDMLPDARIALKWTTSLAELDNGNFIVGNCHAGADNPQVFEITRDKKVVWQFNQYETFGNGLACSQVLTQKQAALVRKLLIGQAGAANEQYGAQRTSIDLGKYKGFLLKPLKLPADGTRPWVWYAPTIGSYPNKSNEWVLRKLLDRGFHVCGINVGESHGSPEGRQAFTEFYQHLVREYKLDARANLLAQSRGGLMLYNWAAENPDKVRCIAGIYPVCDLRSYPGLGKAAGAYGLTPEELEKQLTQHNPIDRLGPLAKAGVPILHIHGDADAVVPLEKNSQGVAERYARLGGKMKLIVVPGKGHAEIPEYFQEQRLVQFLSEGGFTKESSR